MKDPYLIERKGNVYHATKVKRFVLSVCLIIGTPKSYPPNYKAPLLFTLLERFAIFKKKKRTLIVFLIPNRCPLCQNLIIFFIIYEEKI